MAKYFLEFSNIAPDVVEVRVVGTTSIVGIEVPADAISFCFFDEDRRYVAPHYWVTENVDRGGHDELLGRHPSARPMMEEYANNVGATGFALVTQANPDGGYDLKAIMPITADTAFVERATGRRLFV